MKLAWYAAYGSNLSRERFLHYINGGRPDGAKRAYPGCRDRSAPKRDRPYELPGELIFAKHSETWDGGVAFLDIDDRRSAARARLYLVGFDQLEDIVAQENRLDPGSVHLDAPDVGTEQDLGRGFYPLVVGGDPLDGHPVASISDRTSAYSKPSVRYLGHVARGLRETHAMSSDEIADYLLAKPGVRGVYTREEIVSELGLGV